MKKGLLITLIIVAVILIIVIWGVGKYNAMQRAKIDVQNQFAQVQAAYQRRYDLIPNLVETVKGAANFEKSTLTAVVEARAKMGGTLQLPKEAVNDPQAFANLQQANEGLSSALQRLMVVVERYPELKANQNYLSLQEQLEGTENRINQERRIYNDTAAKFNKLISVFPNNIIAGMFNFKPVEMFKAAAGAEQAPQVDFGV
ncbi:MAG TPA: LemA family protein [Candidatus Cloacimonadota bacterium]|nr:LemA family protein [Candidatus Cloacimonadota bacterium]HQL15556.1 LemA family protein [Candidatus Cloacimonadota bacterium]